MKKFTLQKKKQTGFTLIELLITVAIMGILAGVAYPSYLTYVTKSNRAEPQRELLELANLMEQYFIDNRSYTDDLLKLGKSASSYDTDSGNYTISATIVAADNTFKIKAATKTGSIQARDTVCAEMTIDNTGKKEATSATCWEK